MGLEKAIAHGKEHRKPYNDSRAVASECRNHGKCDYCLSNRMHGFEKQKQAAEQKLKEYWQGDEQDFLKSGPSPFLLLSKKVKKLIDNLSPHAIYRKIIVKLSYDSYDSKPLCLCGFAGFIS